ncbi:MAG: methionyl-tRNA formyltransferase [Isosphaeraceae bacterium]
MASPLRIVMLGTGDFALPTFLQLCESGEDVVALITQPDRPQGRKQTLVPSRIKVAAMDRKITILQPEDLNAPEGVEAVRNLAPDLLVTAAYGQILSSEVLAIPRLGGINLHGSILPSYRGAAPVARAIERGEVETGVTVILMNPKVDAGGMLHVARTPIDPDETAGELEARLAVLGAPLVVKAVHELTQGSAVVRPQDRSRVTRAPKLRKEDGQIDWSKSAITIHNLVRAMQPWPIASSYLHRADPPGAEPLRVIVHKSQAHHSETTATPGQVIEASGDRLRVAAGTGTVSLLTVQIPGKRAMPVSEFLRGHRVDPGDRFGPHSTP